MCSSDLSSGISKLSNDDAPKEFTGGFLKGVISCATVGFVANMLEEAVVCVSGICSILVLKDDCKIDSPVRLDVGEVGSSDPKDCAFRSVSAVAGKVD